MKRYPLLLVPTALVLFAFLVLGGAGRAHRRASGRPSRASVGGREEVAADYYHRKYQARHWRECVLAH